MKFVITHPRFTGLYFEGEFYFTNRTVEAPLSTMLRIARTYEVKVETELGVNGKYDPTLFKDKKLFGLTANADLTSGFGLCTHNLVDYSMRLGYDIRWIGKNNNDPLFSGLAKKEIVEGMAMVWHEQPKGEWLDTMFPKNIAIVPFETTKVPSSWIKRLNFFDAVFVPCEQNKGMMEDSGVRVPIEVIKWGVRDDQFHDYKPFPRKPDSPFTFGIMGMLSKRKGVDLLVKAFELAFPRRHPRQGQEAVRLICKTSDRMFHFLPKPRDPRIEVYLGQWEYQDLVERFWSELDVFVWPSRGEGAGLGPLEALAYGIPAIYTDWSGMRDYLSPEVGWPLTYSMVHADDFEKSIYHEDCGDWAEPSLDDLVNSMRHAYEHRDEVKAKGIAGKKWVEDKFLWSNSIHTFISALEKYL